MYVSDNRWHSIIVHRRKRRGYIQVDNEVPIRGVASSPTTVLTTNGKLFIGNTDLSYVFYIRIKIYNAKEKLSSQNLCFVHFNPQHRITKCSTYRMETIPVLSWVLVSVFYTS